MKRTVFWSIVLIGLYLCNSAWALNEESRAIRVIRDLSHESGKLGAYRALIIGINDYEDKRIPPLKTAINDAKTLAEVLRDKYGFQVELILDHKATKKALYKSLRNLAESSKPDDSVLIYYAGHGDLDRTYNAGWWIPVDAKGGDPFTYLDNVQVQNTMRAMKARHVLLVSDSCYSGTLFGRARAMPSVITEKYYFNLYNEKSRWGMTSGNKTPVSDADTGGHSIFAYQLIKELEKNEKPYLTTQEIYTRIAPIVSNNAEQTPLCSPILNTGDQGGEFVFVAALGKGPGPIKPEKVALPPDGGAAFDDILNAGKEQQQAVERWTAWQVSRETEYSQAREIDKNSYLKPEQKKAAWERFLTAVSDNNPFSTKDDELRENAEERVRYWKEYKVANISQKPVYSKPSPSTSDALERDGVYVAYANGIVKDTNTGLEWKVGPDKDMDWNEAKTWVESLNLGGDEWRMPTKDELAALHKKIYENYKKTGSSQNMTLFKFKLKILGSGVWSGETRDSSWSWISLFGSGGWHPRHNSNGNRAFAVRSRNEG